MEEARVGTAAATFVAAVTASPAGSLLGATLLVTSRTIAAIAASISTIIAPAVVARTFAIIRGPAAIVSSIPAILHRSASY